MPPESLPWDRRDFRKHGRSGSVPRFGGGGFGGGGGGGGPHRWREQQQHQPHAPPPYNHQQQQRWYPDFRSPRLLPPGQSKHGGGHMYSDDAGQGFVPLGSRYAERNSEAENCGPFFSRGDGRYLRNNRENRGSFTQKDWKAPSLEPAASPRAPGKPITEVNNLRSIENTQACLNSSSSSHASHPPNSVNLSDKSQSLVKEKPNKNGGTADETTGSGQESEKENRLGSVDWKPVKWTRVGSVSSRGSSFSHSSSSKSMGVDSTEIVAEVQPKNATLVQSSSADAACVQSNAPAEFDESGARKKRRLGWGEGLAKYEKKKVEGPEEGASKNELVLSVVPETLQSQLVNLPEKSPRVASLPDCASPATPSSVACSTSLGIGEKGFIKEANVDRGTTNLSCSPSIASQSHCDGPRFTLENLELASIANLSSLINELLQSNDHTSAEAGYVQTTSMNKLLVWKVDMLKALEMTESKIESLETELKSLITEPRICCPAGSSSLPGEEKLKPCEGLVTASRCGIKLDPLQIDSSGEMIIENARVGPEDVHILSKDEDIDSPGSATSKFVEVLPSIFPPETAESIEGSMNLDVNNGSNLDERCLKNGLSYEENSGYVDNHVLIGREDLTGVINVHCDVDNIYDSIFSSNRDAATRAMEQFNKLLPKEHLFDSSVESSISSLRSDPSIVKERFLMRRRLLRFKEKVLTLRFKLFQHFWIEGRLVSVRKLRGKTRMKSPSRNGHKRNHSFLRSRASCNAVGPQTVPADEVIEFVNGLLSEMAFKPYRNTLKMPALILDKEVKMSRFITYNGLVEDPCAVEKERSMINSWTSEEKEIFVDKLAAYGKDFRKIASFLDHKTVADCIEFYYKNQKSKCFEKVRKNPSFSKQTKSQSTTYLVASGKRRNRELNAASLDILGAASEIAATANIDNGMDIQLKQPSSFAFGASSSCKDPRADDGTLQGSDSMNMDSNERETEAADVLASICGSISSEAMSSCITSSVDHPGDGYRDQRDLRIGSSTKRPLTPEVTQDVDDECSDESCGELNPTDWSDEEKSIFIQAVSIYGKDFVMISQCVRTRSIDQCKLFFSKARKCLGLDLIQPGAGTASGDANGGGSDIEDGCTVETGSVICNTSLESKMEEDLPPPHMKLSPEAGVVGAQNFGPDFKITKGNNGLGPLDSVTAEPVSTISSMIGSHGDDKPVTDFNVHSEGQCAKDVACVSMQELQTVSSTTGSEQGVEDERGMPNKLSETENKALVEVSDGHCGEENQQQGPSLPEGNPDNTMVEDRDANSSELSDISSGISETKSESQPSGIVSHPSVIAHSSMQVDKISEFQKKAVLDTFSTEKSCVSSLHQNGHSASMTSSTLFSVPIKYLPGHSLSDSVESSQFLQGYPVPVQTMREMSGNVNCEKQTALPNASKQDATLNSDLQTDFVLEKCNRSRQQGNVVEAPFTSLEQSKDHSRCQSGCSSASDNPSRKGDVKLFGKILVSSKQKTNNSSERTDDNSSQDHKIGHRLLNLKLGADQKFNDQVNLDSAESNFDCNNFIGTDNIPVSSYGFWDGNRIQTGIPPLPDSALLLAKYPAAFGNYVPPNVKLQQPPLHGMVTTSDCPMNVLPSRALSDSNILADYQGLGHRELQPFTIAMKQTQDIAFAEMQRRNGFNVVSGMQQAGGMSGVNVGGRRGVFVGGQCSSLSDPVAAIKMHYAKAEQFSMQGGEYHQRG